jgi:FkbM family methyltransferase
MLLERVKRKLDFYWLRATGHYDYLTTKVDVDKVWCGTEYGGYYVCPSPLQPGSVVYSIGVGEDASFDIEMIRRWNCTVHAFDPTPKAITWVEHHMGGIANYHFHPYGLGAKTETATFFLPVNEAYVSGSYIAQRSVDTNRAVQVQLKSLADIGAELGHTRIGVLKVDIEGAEYGALESVLNSGLDIEQILIEFHDRLMPEGEVLTMRAVDLLAQHGYAIFARSATLEVVSFIRTSR